MPFENEHSARLADPKSFIRIRRNNDRGGPGIDFLFGVRKDGKSEIQAIRFDRKKFTVAQAKKWLADHDFKPIEFEDATGGASMSESMFWEREDGFEWKIEEQAEIPKLKNEVLNLRQKDFPKGRCGLCRYFSKPETCKILEGPVGAELVCDGFQGLTQGFPLYDVSDDNWLAFVQGMVKEQPYQHIVVAGHLTPTGPIVIIKDTIKPNPHIFSLSKDFHIGHTSTEHHWTQEDVDRLIKLGEEKVEAREAFHIRGTHWVPVPESGSCPVSHPKKMRLPQGDTRCFTNSAATALEQSRMRASEAIVQFDLVRYFEVLNNQVHDLGDKVPENLEPLTSRPGWALIQEDRQTNQSFAQVIRENLDEAGITVLAREIIERKKESRLVVVVGRAIGKLDSNRTIYRGLTAFGWEGGHIHELVEGIRPPFDLPIWKASFNLAGAMLDLDLWPMTGVEARALGHQLSEANENVAIEFRAQYSHRPLFVKHWWKAWSESEVPKERERLRGAHIGRRFRNMRGLVGNLAPEDEKRMDPFHGNREVFAVAIETPEKQPARVLRIGEENRATAERLARDVAQANPHFRVVLAKVVGLLDGQEVFEIIADAKSSGEEPRPAEPRQEPAPAQPRGEIPPAPVPISDDRPI